MPKAELRASNPGKSRAAARETTAQSVPRQPRALSSWRRPLLCRRASGTPRTQAPAGRAPLRRWRPAGCTRTSWTAAPPARRSACCTALRGAPKRVSRERGPPRGGSARQHRGSGAAARGSARACLVVRVDALGVKQDELVAARGRASARAVFKPWSRAPAQQSEQERSCRNACAGGDAARGTHAVPSGATRGMGADQSQMPLVQGLTELATWKPLAAPAPAAPVLAACLATWLRMKLLP